MFARIGQAMVCVRCSGPRNGRDGVRRDAQLPFRRGLQDKGEARRRTGEVECQWGAECRCVWLQFPPPHRPRLTARSLRLPHKGGVPVGGGAPLREATIPPTASVTTQNLARWLLSVKDTKRDATRRWRRPGIIPPGGLIRMGCYPFMLIYTKWK